MNTNPFPKLYAILDADVLSRSEIALPEFALALQEAGVELVQYRDKSAAPATILHNAAAIRSFVGSDTRLIMNDRADLAVLAGFDGVHVGQGDLSPADARRVAGPARWVGISTHTDTQVRTADSTDADYIAVGPVFATDTKLDAEPVIGLEGVRRARALTLKPVVAIGGITRSNARSVIDAGADSIAVISGLIRSGEPVEKVARDFLAVLR
jgi:thiamine-phosphate pyrophosphorylase